MYRRMSAQVVQPKGGLSPPVWSWRLPRMAMPQMAYKNDPASLRKRKHTKR